MAANPRLLSAMLGQKPSQAEDKLNWPIPDDNAVGRVYEPWRIEVLKDLLNFPHRVFPEGPGVPYSLPNDARKWAAEDWGHFVNEGYMNEWIGRK